MRTAGVARRSPRSPQIPRPSLRICLLLSKSNTNSPKKTLLTASPDLSALALDQRCFGAATFPPRRRRCSPGSATLSRRRALKTSARGGERPFPCLVPICLLLSRPQPPRSAQIRPRAEARCAARRLLPHGLRRLDAKSSPPAANSAAAAPADRRAAGHEPPRRRLSRATACVEPHGRPQVRRLGGRWAPESTWEGPIGGSGAPRSSMRNRGGAPTILLAPFCLCLLLKFRIQK